jgi:3-oxoadipate enol-lactonase
VRLHHDVTGDGPAVVLLHCALCDGRQWDRQVETFSREFRVVRLDLPGFGRSPFPEGEHSVAEEVLALLDRLGIERAALVGNSMGGGVALDTALTAPERAWALVLVDSGFPGREQPPEVQAYAEEEDALLEAGDVDGAVELNLRFWLDGPRRAPDEVDPAVRARVADMQRLGLESYLALDREPGPQRRPDGVPADVRCPTLVVVGDLDQPDMLRSAERFEAEIPGARRVVIHGAAHVPSLDRPDEFDRAVLDFLRDAA